MSRSKDSIATFGAGCFWSVEEAFRKLEGVTSTVVGFMGGTKTDPTYQDVCTGTTGHIEVVQVTYDPRRISYERLIDAFWTIHDPTSRDRQGLDSGVQYRSVIFYHTKEQQKLAQASRDRLEASGCLRRGIVTEIRPAGRLWEAEDYHQDYLQKRALKTC